MRRIFGVFQLCAHGDVRFQEPRDHTVGFGADSGPDEIALLGPRHLSQNVKLNACDGPADRQPFHSDSGASTYAMRTKPRAGEFIRESH